MPPGLAAAVPVRRRLSTAATTPLSSLTDALLATRLASHLLTTPHLPAALLPAAPLPLPVHLHILRHPALPPASKLSFFLAATPPASPLLASTFPALLRALAAGSPTLLDELLPFALSCPSPAALLPALLASILSASHLDAALALLDAAPPDLLPRLAAAALPSLIASPDIIAAVTAATADAGAAAAEGRTGRHRRHLRWGSRRCERARGPPPQPPPMGEPPPWRGAPAIGSRCTVRRPPPWVIFLFFLTFLK